MSKRYEMRFTGSGGQGVILASVILAEAAVLSDIQVVQSQSYGPEARGGMCKAETVLSREEICFTKVQNPDFLLCLTQTSLNQYGKTLADEALVLADSSLEIPEYLDPQRVIQLPILQTARDVVGRPMTANIVAVGAINELTKLFSNEALAQAVRLHIPAGTEELNMRALEMGKQLANHVDVTRIYHTKI